MAKQETLLKFFNRSSGAVTLKRSLSSEPKDVSIKKKKLSAESPEKDQANVINSNSEGLSPDKRQLIECNRLNALIKKTSRATPALHENIGPTWFKALQSQFTKSYFIKLSEFLDTERQKYTIYPPADKVFSWTHHFDIEKVKVVILGQDPYHQPKQAHGLSFSVECGVALPPSLMNIFKELKSDIPDFVPPKHGNLTNWSKQGVLLLNACLTVRDSNPNSHKDRGWEEFTNAVIQWIAANVDNVVFLLWGEYAKKKMALITINNKKNHCVLASSHPSPLGVRHGFSGCRHFSKANEFLVKHDKEPIHWNQL